MSLTPCPSCTRHVRTTDAACPFCGSALTPCASVDASVVRAPTRSGVMVGVLVGAVAISSAVLGSACAAYGGAPAPDAGHDAGAPDAGP